jgi:hypothetical protein
LFFNHKQGVEIVTLLTQKGKKTIALMVGVCVAIGAYDAAAQKKDAAKKEAAPAQQQQQQANPVTQEFMNKGVQSCAGRINQVTNFLGMNSTMGALLFVPSQNQDKSLTSVALEIVSPDKRSAYSSATFAPNQANGCGAVYDAVTWWPSKCDAVLKDQYAGKSAAGKLNTNITVVNIDNSARVFLMPTKDGCISIKKELVQ